MALADPLTRPPATAVDRWWNVVLVDPGLLTAPYDAALSKGLAANGVEPCWVTRQLRDGEEDELGAEAVPVFYPRTDGPQRRMGGLWRALKGVEHFGGLRALERLVGSMRPDVVHFQWAMLPLLDLATITRLRRICPVILTVHDVHPFNGKAVNPLQRSGLDRLWHGVDSLIVHTEAGRSALLAAGLDVARIAVVPHGLLGTRTQTVTRQPRSGRWRIVQFGRIQAYKGVDLLVEALGLLDDATRDKVSVTIAGEPQIDMDPIKRRAAALGLDRDTVDFRLWRHSRVEMEALLAEADAFVFPYRAIEASGVLYEVASLRRWIIASRLGAFAELLGTRQGVNMGTLVPAGDAGALAQALANTINSIPAGDLSDAVPDWAEIGAKTCAVYAAATEMWRSGRSTH